MERSGSVAPTLVRAPAEAPPAVVDHPRRSGGRASAPTRGASPPSTPIQVTGSAEAQLTGPVRAGKSTPSGASGGG